MQWGDWSLPVQGLQWEFKAECLQSLGAAYALWNLAEPAMLHVSCRDNSKLCWQPFVRLRSRDTRHNTGLRPSNPKIQSLAVGTSDNRKPPVIFFAVAGHRHSQLRVQSCRLPCAAGAGATCCHCQRTGLPFCCKAPSRSRCRYYVLLLYFFLCCSILSVYHHRHADHKQQNQSKQYA